MRPAMALNWLSIVAAGLAGTLGLTLVMLAGTAAGLGRLNFPMLLGTMFSPPGGQALTVGMLWHLAHGVLFALVYSAAFSLLALPASWSAGLAAGLAHTAVAGLLLGLVGAVHPRVHHGHMPAPGPFGIRYGAQGVVVLLAAHLVYGGIVGALLGL